ncbi:hypothetical protein BOTBODRAFT_225313 [Botryobasidium botryosum FD-172 SS1]|uniref:Uncharacterized protein n=1 Tax=Botryobasidium botryosum (strain FD-172 SS1) TaxID=930990 RepID=A0A067MMW4_BOTB1|nr:hypothetical protein BOTBODRAFT_225313 [Botryobasidium botryosum FD-172 SS1]
MFPGLSDPRRRVNTSQPVPFPEPFRFVASPLQGPPAANHIVHTDEGLKFLEEIPIAVRIQEQRELTKLRYVLRRRRKANPSSLKHRILRRIIYPTAQKIFTPLCLFLNVIYEDRHRMLSYAVFEPDTWPKMFTEQQARHRASTAWESHINSMIGEWTNSNIISVILVSSVGAPHLTALLPP